MATVHLHLHDAEGWEGVPRAKNGEWTEGGATGGAGGQSAPLTPGQKAAATKRAKAAEKLAGIVQQKAAQPPPDIAKMTPGQKAAATKKANLLAKLQAAVEKKAAKKQGKQQPQQQAPVATQAEPAAVESPAWTSQPKVRMGVDLHAPDALAKLNAAGPAQVTRATGIPVHAWSKAFKTTVARHTGLKDAKRDTEKEFGQIARQMLGLPEDHLALLRKKDFNVTLVDTISFDEGAPDVFGYVQTRGPDRLEPKLFMARRVQAPDVDAPVEDLRREHAVAHELGHAIDYSAGSLSDGSIADVFADELKKARVYIASIADTPEDDADIQETLDYFMAPDEMFAELYAHIFQTAAVDEHSLAFNALLRSEVDELFAESIAGLKLELKYAGLSSEPTV